MKLKINKNSQVLIKYCDGTIKEGIVLEANGDCLKIKTAIFRLGWFRVSRKRWYSFSLKSHYTLIVKDAIDKE